MVVYCVEAVRVGRVADRYDNMGLSVSFPGVDMDGEGVELEGRVGSVDVVVRAVLFFAEALVCPAVFSGEVTASGFGFGAGDEFWGPGVECAFGFFDREVVFDWRWWWCDCPVVLEVFWPRSAVGFELRPECILQSVLGGREWSSESSLDSEDEGLRDLTVVNEEGFIFTGVFVDECPGSFLVFSDEGKVGGLDDRYRDRRCKGGCSEDDSS